MAKARYYGLATMEEKNDVRYGSGVQKPNNGVLSYSAVVGAIRLYKAEHPNFDDLSVNVAADRIATTLNQTGLYGSVHNAGNRIVSNGYSIALTKGKGTEGMITASHASERVGDENKKKK